MSGPDITLESADSTKTIPDSVAAPRWWHTDGLKVEVPVPKEVPTTPLDEYVSPYSYKDSVYTNLPWALIQKNTSSGNYLPLRKFVWPDSAIVTETHPQQFALQTIKVPVSKLPTGEVRCTMKGATMRLMGIVKEHASGQALVVVWPEISKEECLISPDMIKRIDSFAADVSMGLMRLMFAPGTLIRKH